MLIRLIAAAAALVLVVFGVFGLILGLGGSVAAPAEAAERPPLEIRGVEARVVPTGQGPGLEIAIVANREPLPTLFTLTGPERVVLDLTPFTWGAGTPALPEGIAALRHGLFTHELGRIVLDLARPFRVARAASRPAGGGWRFEMLLVPTSPDEFAATAGWPEAALWRPDPTRRLAKPGAGDILVVIDPGHGGIDPGASVEGLLEKHLVLAFSKELAEAIAAQDGFVVVMTRDADVFVPLRGRVQFARSVGAHLMLSIHADKLASGGADGLSVYTLSRVGTDDAADAFAARENRSDVLAGANLAGAEDDVTRLLIELARRGSINESIKLADALIAELEGRVELLNTRPHRRGNFFVLKAPDLPSVLVELGFLSSARDRHRFADPAWRDETIGGIVEGILAWTKVASPGFLPSR